MAAPLRVYPSDLAAHPWRTVALEPLRAFRAELHACLTRRADALFDLGDALLCAPAPFASLPHLSLDPAHQRGWGSTYAALVAGRIEGSAGRGCGAPVHRLEVRAGLELGDPGFDFRVLSEFRARLVAIGCGAGRWICCWGAWRHWGWWGPGAGSGPIPPTCWLRCGTCTGWSSSGTARAALEALAAAAPGWLASVIDDAWVGRYGARVDSYRLPGSEDKRRELAVQIGWDGYRLLEAVHAPTAPGWPREVPAVGVLRRVWVQQDYRSVDGDRRRYGGGRRTQAVSGRAGCA
jgi:hypothetical protein